VSGNLPEHRINCQEFPPSFLSPIRHEKLDPEQKSKFEFSGIP
jgi:hypothetical protein